MVDQGQFVTRAELTAHLSPMRDDITEIRTDVKVLVEKSIMNATRADTNVDRKARRTSMIAVIAAVFSAMWWVPDAVAKIVFH